MRRDCRGGIAVKRTRRPRRSVLLVRLLDSIPAGFQRGFGAIGLIPVLGRRGRCMRRVNGEVSGHGRGGVLTLARCLLTCRCYPATLCSSQRPCLRRSTLAHQRRHIRQAGSDGPNPRGSGRGERSCWRSGRVESVRLAPAARLFTRRQRLEPV